MKHIIWDFNGALLNDAQLSVDLDNDVFDQIGVPRITLEDYRNNMTMPVRDFYPRVGVDYARHSYEEIARLWLDEFNKRAVGVGLIPGVLEAIRAMHAQGRSQSVLSASYEPSVRAQCAALGLTPYMKDISGLQDESAGKKTEIGLRQLRELGLTGEEIARGLDAFAGAHRRFELTATIEGVKLYHDYGHNPAEFHSVIPLADAVAGDHRLFVVCQPHTYSRTKLLFDQYMTCFTGADEVLITDIYAAREKDPGDIHATMLVDALQKHGVPAVYTPDFDACENYLRTHWQPGDVMISLGCGNINLLNEQIARHEAEKTN